MDTQNISCPSCQSITHIPFLEKNDFTVVRCPKCWLAYVINPPSLSRLREYYSEKYFVNGKERFGYIDYRKDKEYLQINFRRKVKYIRRFIQKGNLLDIGCGLGFFLELLKDEMKVEGIEISSYAADFARKELGLDVDHIPIEEAKLENNYYDLVTLWDVLDHTTNPFLLLSKTHKTLKKGGYVFIETGDLDSWFARVCGKRWYLMIPPTHLNYFSKKSLFHLLQRIGYKVIDIKYFGKIVPLDLCFFRLSYVVNSPLIKYLQKFFQFLRLNKAKIYYNFHDVMTVVAQK